MKEFKTILFLLLLCSFQSAFGQSNKIEYGVHLGTNQTFQNSSDKEDYLYNPAFGISSGVLFQYNLSEKFSLRTGLNYTLKNYRNTFENPIGYFLYPSMQYFEIAPFRTDRKDGILSMPLLGQYNFGNQRMFYINAGVYANYLLSSKTVYSDLDGANERTYLSSLNNTRRFKLGLSAGFGAKFKLSEKLKLFAELNNQLGFGELIRKGNNELKMDNTNLQIGLNFRL